MSKTTDTAVANAMMELEDDIHCLNSMAQIAADLFDGVRFDKNPGGGFRILITEQERDNIDFAVCNVSTRAFHLKRRFLDATKGEEVS